MNYEIAWAAGFFDGEGSVYVNHRSNRAPRILMAVAQSHREPLDRWVMAVGHGSVSKPHSTTNGKPAYTVRINKIQDIQLAIHKLWFWLSEPKRQQYLRCVSEILEWDTKNPGKRRCKVQLP